MVKDEKTSWKSLAGIVVIFVVLGLGPMVLGYWLFGNVGVPIGCGVAITIMLVLAIWGNWIHKMLSEYVFPPFINALGGLFKKKEKGASPAKK